MMKKKRLEVISKIILMGTLRNVSSIIIGKGRGDLIDREVIKDEEGKFYIPGTSFIGALKHHIKKSYSNRDLEREQEEYFWGSQEKRSHFIVSDVTAKNTVKINIRDGVAIDYHLGVAKKGSKYDYEVVEPDTEFDLKMELILHKEMNKNDFKRKGSDVNKKI